MKYNISAMLCVALVATNTYADELFFECEFEKSKLSGGDADAQAWLNDFSFRRHKFVYQTEPPKIVDGPDSGSFWGEPRITVGKQEIEFEWHVKANPLDRAPAISLSVNRFSGKALESYSMLKGPNQGPLLVHWARSGHCEIYKRKV